MAKKGKSDAPPEPRGPAKEKARFFHNLAPIRTYLHMKSPRKGADDERVFTLMFRMTLNGNLIRSAPDFVQTAYDGVQEHDEDYVGIKQAIEGVNIDLFETDKNKNPSLQLGDVTIDTLEVKEIRSGKGDPSIVLTFQVEYPVEREVWNYIRTHYAGDVFMVFDSAQASLLDLEDVKKDSRQSELPMPPSGKDAAAGEANVE